MTSPPIGDGFEVDPARLHGVAGELGSCYDDFCAVSEEFARGGSGSAVSGSAVFGDVGSAWSSFDNAWTNELLTTKTAIAELIGKVSSTADTYRDVEYQNEKQVRDLHAKLQETFG
ncbi:MAG: hypothetical protein J2P25_24385 [Nocardiopsaceae bacterium]|nr:hypothetical protein [Nocardiopsaceae bacterium]